MVLSTQMRRRFSAKQRIAALVIALALPLATGCAEKEPRNDRATTAAPASGQLTDDEYQKFAKRLETAARSADVDALNQAIDWDAIIARKEAGDIL